MTKQSNIAIVPFTPEYQTEIDKFNSRLKEGGCSFQFGANPQSTPALRGIENEIRPEHFVAIDKNGIVRGAYTLIFQRFLLNQAVEELAFIQLPLSEGIVNPSFRNVGLHLLNDAIRRSPLLFGLGMGGMDRPLPRLFKAIGADVREVPFFFQVLKPRPFLRNVTLLRRSRIRRITAATAAATGFADILFGIVHAVTGHHAVARRSVRFDIVPEFPDSVDEIWQLASARYSLISIRNRETLNYLYPASDPRYRRLMVWDGSRVAGWALLTDSQLKDHNYFGNMRLGALVNCLAAPGYEDLIAASATYYFQDTGVDMIVSNQLHPGWAKALRRCGYLPYQSNFLLATVKALTNRIKCTDENYERVHINRGDGDGAYNL